METWALLQMEMLTSTFIHHLQGTISSPPAGPEIQKGWDSYVDSYGAIQFYSCMMVSFLNHTILVCKIYQHRLDLVYSLENI